MLTSSQKLLAKGRFLNNATNFIRQSRFFEATTSASPVGPDGKYFMKAKPQALDHKLWKNGLEVSLSLIQCGKRMCF